SNKESARRALLPIGRRGKGDEVRARPSIESVARVFFALDVSLIACCHRSWSTYSGHLRSKASKTLAKTFVVRDQSDISKSPIVDRMVDTLRKLGLPD